MKNIFTYISEQIAYLPLISRMSKYNTKNNYQNFILGRIWQYANPIIMATFYYIVFGFIFKRSLGAIYLVPTPIGNLGDISDRARRTLEEADFIAAEDTRVSLKLLNHLGIKKSLISYFEHNKTFKGQMIVDRILAGETCALVSDAGSPAISDPGEELVKQCAEAGITVCAIPGPCAVITALSISGQATGRFCFEGFLSTAKKSRKAHLEDLKDERRTMIFYEAPHKIGRVSPRKSLPPLGTRTSNSAELGGH